MDTAIQGIPQEPSLESEYSERPQRSRSRVRTNTTHSAMHWANLERACRIALLETDQPASVEAIHDRIVRRGSFVFFSYERAFRAITLAMARLVRRGEAVLMSQQGSTFIFKRFDLPDAKKPAN